MYVRRCISTGKLIPHYVISARSAKFKSRLPARLDRFWRLVLVRGVFSFTYLRLGIENSASKMKPECPFKGRPIVSCRGYCTTPASRYVAYHIKSLMKSASTVYTSTNDVVKSLITPSNDDLSDCSLLTADVESLYTCMSWKDTTNAMHVFLDENNHPMKDLLIDLSSFVLRNNVFEHDGLVYHQENGMAMGTTMAVNVANIFLFVHERTSLSVFRNTIKFFGRYVDDLLLIIKRLSNLPAVKRHMYAKLDAIRLTWSDPSKSIEFLDLIISINDKSTFTISTFQNPRNAYLYIPFTSDHPRSCFRAFIKAELLRYNHTNSEIAALLAIRDAFWTRLRKRGYPPRFLHDAFSDTPGSCQLIPPASSVEASASCPTVFDTDYHPGLLSLQRTLQNSFGANLCFRKPHSRWV